MDKRKWMKVGIVAGVVVIAVAAFVARGLRKTDDSSASGAGRMEQATGRPLPRLVDLGAGTCIPCKMMAPILEELKKEYAGRMEVVVIDVNENAGAAEQYGVQIIPTQIFFDAAGRELMRHEGFISKEDILATFRDLGVDIGGPVATGIVRETPLAQDTRPKGSICFMCNGDADPKTRVQVLSSKGNTSNLCSPHCYFILESCLVDKASAAEVGATDYATGGAVPLERAVFLYGVEARGRPAIKAFASRDAAEAEMRASGGSILALDAVRDKEYSVRCGFCDRAMYLQDNGSTVQVVGGPKTYGCCPHCALGVATRLGRDIVVENKDPVTGERIRIETFDGRVKSLDPPTAVAWFGQKRKPDGSFGSAGCFHQWNFVSVDNLRKWLETHPRETGRLITIHKALATKMKMSPEKIKKACKIGECR